MVTFPPFAAAMMIDSATAEKPAVMNAAPAPGSPAFIALVYDELRATAAEYLRRERREHTLQPTALVHEAYLHLAQHTTMRWQDRRHFFCAAAQAMRRILVDHARRKRALKRGGGEPKEAWDESVGSIACSEVDLVELDGALQELSKLDGRQSEIVQLRFFVGLTNEEIAGVLTISPTTVSGNGAWRKPGCAAALLMQPTLDRWTRVKELFAAASDVGVEDRATLLDTSCGDDSSLRREVECLLAADEEVDGFIETPAAVLPSELWQGVPNEPLVGRRFGAYEILTELGRGGLSVVYLARRADHQFEKSVAIKLIKRGRDTEDILRRFRTERRILASLDHPNIARLLDAGTTADGLPYFVMELVKGDPSRTTAGQRS